MTDHERQRAVLGVIAQVIPTLMVAAALTSAFRTAPTGSRPARLRGVGSRLAYFYLAAFGLSAAIVGILGHPTELEVFLAIVGVLLALLAVLMDLFVEYFAALRSSLPRRLYRPGVFLVPIILVFALVAPVVFTLSRN